MVVGANGNNAYSNDCLNWSSGNALPSNNYDKIVFGKNKFVSAVKKGNIVGLQFHPESIMTEYGLLMIKNWVNYSQD